MNPYQYSKGQSFVVKACSSEKIQQGNEKGQSVHFNWNKNQQLYEKYSNHSIPENFGLSINKILNLYYSGFEHYFC